MHVVLIDNRDSFTFNLEQQIRALGAGCTVVESRSATVSEISKLRPDRIVLSPGPGRPEGSGVSLEVLKSLSSSVPVLGVCLGHQCMAAVFGKPTDVVHAPAVMHGKTSEIFHDGSGLMRSVPSPFTVARYHSLIVKRLPKDFLLMCWTGTQKKPELIMGMRHKTLPVFGVQFHPESFLTENGDRLMRNFLDAKW